VVRLVVLASVSGVLGLGWLGLSDTGLFREVVVAVVDFGVVVVVVECLPDEICFVAFVAVGLSLREDR
jgi:hypothetical protein